MITVSKPLSAGQAQNYHKTEFANAKANYYTEQASIVGQWHGKLAASWGLTGAADETHFQRLAQGQHPVTSAQLVQHQVKRTKTNEKGEPQSIMEHRAGWDATFAAPKSVSLTALVGGDERVRAAHEASVTVALDELERWVQARISNTGPAVTTGNFAAVKFAHDSSRPVDGYAAPQVHTHVVVFNMTRTQDGQVRPLQTLELLKSQQYITAVYRSELALRLQAIGYRIERGESGQPEIIGYSRDYLDASSPRRQQIKAELDRLHMAGAGASEIAQKKTRGKKVDLSAEDVQRAHQVMATKFGHQPDRVVRLAQAQGAGGMARETDTTARQAVTYAKERNMEREAVVDERAFLRDALARSMGERTVREIQTEFERRAAGPELIQVTARRMTPARQFTTPEMTALERENIARMRQGQGMMPPLAAADIRRDVADHYQHLSAHQRAAIAQILASQDKVQGLRGVAGGGKTTALLAVRDAAEREGYHVHGLAPTSIAAHKLGDEAGIPATTLQKHLAQADVRDRKGQTLWILDESSLASTVQMRDFLGRQHPKDRVLLVGDERQHEAVDAGTPFRQLQDTGLAVAHLTEILRQQDPALKQVVEDLSRGEIPRAIRSLEGQGRVHGIAEKTSRYRAIAAMYLENPGSSLVISPDNQSRREINDVIHESLQRAGQIEPTDHPTWVLVTRSDITQADRQWAKRYELGDIVRYTTASTIGVAAGEYARVVEVRPQDNQIRVRQENGATLTYDPKRLHGVTLYREQERAFAVGDRVQFTAPQRDLGVANRQQGTIQSIHRDGRLDLKMHSGKTVIVPAGPHRHLDHGYAVTSHSSQCLTTGRGIVNVETTQSAAMVNRQFIYVAGSRGRDDLQIFTDDRSKLETVLNREIGHQTALWAGQDQTTQTTRQHVGQSLGL